MRREMWTIVLLKLNNVKVLGNNYEYIKDISVYFMEDGNLNY